MRYAIFSDIHANVEALEAVLAKIDEIAQQEPIDHVWFLGDLVGYGPNPNECIEMLRARTEVIIAGNHDWAAVEKIELDDFSAAARASAEWTAQQLTKEHRDFLIGLPERIEIGDFTLVHGSPYGPLWEYLTFEALAERSFQHFDSRFCLVGHTHVPIIFQQPDPIAALPTSPLQGSEHSASLSADEDDEGVVEEDDEETTKIGAIRPAQQSAVSGEPSQRALVETEAPQTAENEPVSAEAGSEDEPACTDVMHTNGAMPSSLEAAQNGATHLELPPGDKDSESIANGSMKLANGEIAGHEGDEVAYDDADKQDLVSNEGLTSEEEILSAEDRLNTEIEELLALLGLSQSLVKVTNEMLVPPEGLWPPPEGYRAIINPGGVGQPRDGDPRAAFMIYDSERGFTFYRVAYPFEKTQEKIIKAGLPPYLATRLAYGR